MRTYMMRKRPKHKLLEDVHELCRLCLQKSKDQMTIFNDDSPVCPLALRIRMCVGLEVTKEECLSNIICKECFQQLDQIYAFRKKCEMTYRKFKSHMIALKESLNNVSSSEILKLEFYDDDIEDILEDKFNINNKKDRLKQSNELNVDNQCTDIKNNNLGSSGIVNIQSGSQFPEMVNLEVIPKTPEPQLPEQDGVTFSTFLTNLLVKVGVLVLQDDGTLSLPDGGTNTIHLDMGENQITIQLTEEAENTIVTSSLIEMPNESQLVIKKDETKIDEEDVIDKYIIIENNTKKEMDNSERVKCKWPRGAECSKCGKVFSSRGVLNRHMRVHSAERAFPCGSCSRAFTTRASRDRHRHVHKEIRPFACTLCPKSFTQRQNLEQHALSHCEVTTRPRQLFHCRHCTKVFMHQSGLSRHSSSCSNGRQYTCDGCNRPFSDRGSLLRHLKKVCPKQTQTVNNANPSHDELEMTPNVSPQ